MLTYHAHSSSTSTSTREPRLCSTRASLCVSLMLGLSSLVGCGSSVISPQKIIGPLSEAQSESFQGDFDFKGITPTSKLGQSVTSGDLGRAVKITSGESPKLAPPNACAGLIPSRQREDLRERLSDVFDVHILRSLKAGQESIYFPSLEYSAAVEGSPAAGSVISAHLGLTRAISFVNQEELKHYNKCCQLTGSCGEQMISRLYEVSLDARYLSPTAPLIQERLRAFEDEGASLKRPKVFSKLARSIYKAQAAKEENKLPQRGWSHFEYSPLPKPKNVELKKAQLVVAPTFGEIFCKRGKSDRADVIELNVTINGVEGAQELLGYQIKTSKQWVDLSLSDWSGPVKEKKDTITCYPGPDALSSSDNRCPSRFTITVFPPTCESIDGDQDFKWEAEIGVYAPRDESKRPHHLTSAVTSTTVRDQR